VDEEPFKVLTRLLCFMTSFHFQFPIPFSFFLGWMFCSFAAFILFNSNNLHVVFGTRDTFGGYILFHDARKEYFTNSIPSAWLW